MAVWGLGFTWGRAELLDAFESTGGWTNTSGGGASLTMGTSGGVTGQGLQLTYDFPSGSYAQIQKDFSLLNLLDQSANAIQFRYKAIGVANNMEIKFTDNDSTSTAKCDKLDYRFTVLPDGQWRTVVVPLSEFFSFFDGDGAFDMGETAYLALGMVQKEAQLGGGTLWVEDVQLIHLNEFTYVLDSFETNGFNDRKIPGELGGVVFTELGGVGGAGAASYRSDDKVAGAQSIQFDYTVGTSGDPYSALGESFESHPLVVTSTSTRLTFYMKRLSGTGDPRIELWWQGGFNSVELATSPVLTSDFKKFSIPVGNFTGVNLSRVTKLKFVFNVSASTGQVLIDNLALEEAGAGTDVIVRRLDDFSLSAQESFWSLYTHELSAATLDMPFDFTNPAPPGGNRVFRLQYQFPTNSDVLWDVAERRFRPNPLVERVFTMKYKGDGDDSHLEFKVEDDNGVVYSRTVRNATATGGAWKTLRVPIEDLSPFSGGNRLNLRQVRRLSIAISGTGGGAGTLTLDDLYTGEGNSLSTAGGKGGLIQKVTVPENPFSPNGDGTADVAQFIAELGEAADVSVGIYSLRGGKICQKEGGHFNAGTATVLWDGKNDDGRMVENGLYFFRFRAISNSGTEDEVKQVIGVVR